MSDQAERNKEAIGILIDILYYQQDLINELDHRRITKTLREEEKEDDRWYDDGCPQNKHTRFFCDDCGEELCDDCPIIGTCACLDELK